MFFSSLFGHNTVKLEGFLQHFLALEPKFRELKTLFQGFLVAEFKGALEKIKSTLQTENLLRIEITAQQGLFQILSPLLPELIGLPYSFQKAVYLDNTGIIRRADQLAAVILKELAAPDHPPHHLQSLREYLQAHPSFLVIKNFQYLSAEERCLFQQVFSPAGSSKAIFIDCEPLSDESADRLPTTIVLPPLSAQKVKRLIRGLFDHGDRAQYENTELKPLVPLLANHLESILLAIYVKNYYRYSLRSLVKALNSQLDKNSNTIQALLEMILRKSPPELIYVLQRIWFLPKQGFTQQDLVVLCAQKLPSQRNLSVLLRALTYYFGLQLVGYGKEELYSAPHYTRELIGKNLLPGLTVAEVKQLNQMVLKRVESNQLWEGRYIWLGQLEIALNYLRNLNSNYLYVDERSLKRLIALLPEIFLRYGFQEPVHNIILPLCERGIREASKDKHRGSWYELLGNVHQQLAQLHRTKESWELALVDFQRSLKFYNPTLAPINYSSNFEHIGQIYRALVDFQENKADRVRLLELAVKSFNRAAKFHGTQKNSRQLELLLQLAELHLALGGLKETNSDLMHFQRSLNFYRLLLETYASGLEPSHRSKAKQGLFVLRQELQEYPATLANNIFGSMNHQEDEALSRELLGNLDQLLVRHLNNLRTA